MLPYTKQDLKFNDPEVLEIFKFWSDNVKAGYFGTPEQVKTMLGLSFDGIVKGMVEGNIAITYLWDQLWNILATNGLKPVSELDFFIPPNQSGNTKKTVGLESVPVLVSKNSASAKQAYEIARIFMMPEAMERFCLRNGFLYPMKQGSKDSPLRVDPSLMPELSAAEIEALAPYDMVMRHWEATLIPIVEAEVSKFEELYAKPDDWKRLADELQVVADRAWAAHTG
jgi:ABC-type glycerol-3-phosphate transport system substrate-binding protein